MLKNRPTKGARRAFVLDTNVLMHDPAAVFRFEEHDIYLPMVTLEELDNHKKGMSEVARNARQVSRVLDALMAGSADDAIDAGLVLSKLGNKEARVWVSMVKSMIPEITCRIIDEAIQVHGATGISQWTPLAELYADVRHLRFADGPDEVHHMVVSRAEIQKYQPGRNER